MAADEARRILDAGQELDFFEEAGGFVVIGSQCFGVTIEFLGKGNDDAEIRGLGELASSKVSGASIRRVFMPAAVKCALAISAVTSSAALTNFV